MARRAVPRRLGNLHASVSFEGMVRFDGDLDPEAGETLLTALRAVMDAGSRNGSDDDRVWEVNEKSVPPAGTPVTITIRLQDAPGK